MSNVIVIFTYHTLYWYRLKFRQRTFFLLIIFTIQYINSVYVIRTKNIDRFQLDYSLHWIGINGSFVFASFLDLTSVACLSNKKTQCIWRSSDCDFSDAFFFLFNWISKYIFSKACCCRMPYYSVSKSINSCILL